MKYRIGKKYVRRLKPSENPMHLKEKYGVDAPLLTLIFSSIYFQLRISFKIKVPEIRIELIRPSPVSGF